MGLPHPPIGYLAVDFFFMLSGFVVAHAYDARLSSGLSALEFIGLRTKRLWPLHFLGLAMGAIVLAIQLRWSAKPPLSLPGIGSALAAGAIMLPEWWRPTDQFVFPLNGAAWSLFWEMAANAIYAALFRLLSARRLFLVALVGLLLMVIFDHEPDGGWSAGTFWIGGMRVLFAFPLGAALYRVAPRGIGRVPALPLLILLVALFWIPADGHFGTAKVLALVFIAFPALLLLGAGATTGPFTPIYLWLGFISYAVYIIQGPMMILIWGAMHSPWAALVASLFVLTGAWVAARWYDTPMRRWLSSLY